MFRLSAVFSLAILLFAACSSSNNHEDTAPPPRTSERARLKRAEPLPKLALDLLRKNMVEHGDNMESLLWSALMLDHQTTELVARQILAQPRMSRPTPAAGQTLNDGLPAQFFDLQDRMYEAAEELRKAAEARDDVGTAQAYAKLAETCVTCHSVYLSLPGEANREDDGEQVDGE